MVALIEEQIYQFLIEQEEERCKALEAIYNKAIQSLMASGVRQREILEALWEQVNFEGGFLNFSDSTTGNRAIPLNRATLDVLEALPRLKENTHIFPGAKRNKGIDEMKVARKTVSKPWTRPNEFALCQEPELLIMVDEYDYDLSDKMFQDYCSARGILGVAGKPGSRRWKYLADCRKTRSDYLEDSHFQFAEEVDGKRYQYTSEEMETGWKIIRLGRAKFQDCWELYRRESSELKE